MKQKVFYFSVCVVFACFALLSCSQDEGVVFSGNKKIDKFSLFEKDFAHSLSSEKDVIKLIGFKTYDISDDEKPIFKDLINEYGEELKTTNHVFSDNLSFFRLYFPMHTAIVEYEGMYYTADEKGVVFIPNLKDINKVKIIGRKRSETVHGTGSNIIEEDRILLKDEFKIESKNGISLGYTLDESICIFNLSALTSMNQDICCSNNQELCCTNSQNICCLDDGTPRLKSESEKVSCVENHGGKNCSNAFGIYNNNCTFVSTHCMDYNGWFTDCINGKLANFPGSDCSYAMGLGHCWNEYK